MIPALIAIDVMCWLAAMAIVLMTSDGISFVWRLVIAVFLTVYEIAFLFYISWIAK
jgi:hypothetical protein